jgi:hypothetical protein
VAVRRTAGWGLAQCLVDYGQHAVEIPIDLIVPESKDSESLRCEMLIAFCVAARMCIEIVLSAIDLDDEAMLEAHKIDDEIVTRRLTAKVETAFAP